MTAYESAYEYFMIPLFKNSFSFNINHMQNSFSKNS
jgi:hypothetical protein